MLNMSPLLNNKNPSSPPVFCPEALIREADGTADALAVLEAIAKAAMKGSGVGP